MTILDNNNQNEPMTIDQIAERKAAFPGTTLKLQELMHQDGQIAEAIDKANSQHAGVIQSFITAVNDDKNYRQILKNTLWKSTEEQDKAVYALACCEMTGAVNARKMILDRLTARSSGINGFLMHEALEALTHTQFTSTHYDYTKRKNGNRDNSSSPISK